MKFQVLWDCGAVGVSKRSFCNLTGMQGLSHTTLQTTCSPGSWEGKPLNYHQICKSELCKVGTARVSIVFVFFIEFGQFLLCS